MKHIVLFLLSLYQFIFSIIVKQLLGITASCRYSPTCSLYARQQIHRLGLWKGGMLGLKRLLSCHPFAPYGTV